MTEAEQKQHIEEQNLEFQQKAVRKAKAHAKQEQQHGLSVSHTEAEHTTGRLSPATIKERRAQRKAIPDRERVTVTETTTESAYVESMMEYIGVEDFSSNAEEPLKDLAKIRSANFYRFNKKSFL